MPDLVIVPRSGHTVSRSLIDPDALRVLYRLHSSRFTAYLVGGSVRDMLLGRRPKDFDIGTSAHPYEVKKLFRNCWIIGRRFRLAHVRFGTKTIEVATFRRHVSAAELPADETPESRPPLEAATDATGGTATDATADADFLQHRDNTFGTPEEDAFRRDFTINALFYDIADFSIIDYTGGLRDLEARVVRCIGDPDERLQEDPVRMIRAVSMASRLDFTIDPPLDAAIEVHRDLLARSAPARLIEEIYKLLRAGSSEKAFRMLAERGLLGPLAPDLQRRAGDALWKSLGALDAYRRRVPDAPERLTNALLLGTLLLPIGFDLRPPSVAFRPDGKPRKEPALALGILPLARRDIERLRHIQNFQRRLTDMSMSPRARRALLHRGPFAEALTWLDMHGEAPETVEHWRGFIEAAKAFEPEAPAPVAGEPPRGRRRRRRRRRPSKPTPS